jgi:hypothetical protein
MNTVFIVVEGVEYEGQTVLAVFDNYEKAKAYMESLEPFAGTYFDIIQAKVQ